MQIDANGVTQGDSRHHGYGFNLRDAEVCFFIIIAKGNIIKMIVKINNSFVCVGVGGRCNSYCSDITRNYEHRAHTK